MTTSSSFKSAFLILTLSPLVWILKELTTLWGHVWAVSWPSPGHSLLHETLKWQYYHPHLMGKVNWDLKRLNVKGHPAHKRNIRPSTPIFLQPWAALLSSKQGAMQFMMNFFVLAAATALKVISAWKHLTTQILTTPALIPLLGLSSHCSASWHRILGNASTNRY